MEASLRVSARIRFSEGMTPRLSSPSLSPPCKFLDMTLLLFGVWGLDFYFSMALQRRLLANSQPEPPIGLHAHTCPDMSLRNHIRDNVCGTVLVIRFAKLSDKTLTFRPRFNPRGGVAQPFKSDLRCSLRHGPRVVV